MGKSAFALGVAARYALEQEKPVVVFSLEASADDAMSMLLASTAMVDVQRIGVAVGGATRQEWERLGRAADQLASAPLRIVEECVTPEAISARIDGIAERRGVGLVVVDCLHLMETDPEGPPAVNREQQLAVIVRSLKRLARRHRVPVLCTAQLGRSVDSRVDKRPRLTDLRDSGAIEDAADLVLLLYRDDYYDFDSDEKGIAEIWVEKNRFGSAGYFIHAAFLGCYARFVNLAPIEASPSS